MLSAAVVLAAAHICVVSLDASSVPRLPQKEEPSVDFGPYMKELQRRIKRHWFPPKGDESKRVVVFFHVSKGGQLSGLRLLRTSGVPQADQKAIEAVAVTAPFDALPAQCTEKVVDIEFTFDYNANGNSARIDDDSPGATASAITAEERITDGLLEKAKVLEQKKHLPEALSAIEQALRVDPYCDEAMIRGSQYLTASVNTDLSNATAIGILHRALTWDPDNKQAARLLNARLSALGIDPHSFDKVAEYARTLANEGEFDAAIYEMSAALKIKPDDKARAELASMYNKRIAADLIKRWTSALEKVSNAENHCGLGSAFALAGELDKARQEYRKALQVDPNYSMAHSLMQRLPPQGAGGEE